MAQMAQNVEKWPFYQERFRTAKALPTDLVKPHQTMDR